MNTNTAVAAAAFEKLCDQTAIFGEGCSFGGPGDDFVEQRWSDIPTLNDEELPVLTTYNGQLERTVRGDVEGMLQAAPEGACLNVPTYVEGVWQLAVFVKDGSDFTFEYFLDNWS